MSLLTLFGSRGRTYRTDFSSLAGWTTEAGTLAPGLQASALADWLGNLVPNGEFTTDTTGWVTFTLKASVVVDSAVEPGVVSPGTDSSVVKATSAGGTGSFLRHNFLGRVIDARFRYGGYVYKTPGTTSPVIYLGGYTLSPSADNTWQALSETRSTLNATYYYRPGTIENDVGYFDGAFIYRQNAVALSPHRQSNGVWTWTLTQPAAPSVVPFSMLLRYSDALNYWEVRTKPNTAATDLEIVEVNAGVETVRASADVDWTDGGTDGVRITARSTTITVDSDKGNTGTWTQQATYASATHNATANQYGAMLWGTSTNRATALGVTP